VTTANGTKLAGATSGSAITGLVNGTTYYFVVTAMIAGVESATSNEVIATPSAGTTIPAAPTNVTATAGNAQVTVGWTAVTGATSYNIYRSTASGTQGTKIGTSSTAGYTDSSAVNGIAYYYTLTAVNSAGEGVASSQSTVATPSASIVVQKVPATGQTIVSVSGDNATYSNINPMSFTDNGDGTITDNVTGLMWQAQDNGVLMTWSAAGSYCTGLLVGGYSDWRLPSVGELQSIVNYGTFNPAITQTYFPSTAIYSNYWSSTTSVGGLASAWVVKFDTGIAFDFGTASNASTRCVRLGQNQSQSFTDNGNGTITDNITTLMWQKQDTSLTYTWQQAITYCSGLSLGGLGGWRLPNVKELRSIVNVTTYNPAINSTYFPSTQSLYYWSSTYYAANSNVPWNVHFNNGKVNADNFASNNFYARCVHLGQ
jgi:hypothetical protein